MIATLQVETFNCHRGTRVILVTTPCNSFAHAESIEAIFRANNPNARTVRLLGVFDEAQEYTSNEIAERNLIGPDPACRPRRRFACEICHNTYDNPAAQAECFQSHPPDEPEDADMSPAGRP